MNVLFVFVWLTEMRGGKIPGGLDRRCAYFSQVIGIQIVRVSRRRFRFAKEGSLQMM